MALKGFIDPKAYNGKTAGSSFTDTPMASSVTLVYGAVGRNGDAAIGATNNLQYRLDGLCDEGDVLHLNMHFVLPNDNASQGQSIPQANLVFVSGTTSDGTVRGGFYLSYPNTGLGDCTIEWRSGTSTVVGSVSNWTRGVGVHHILEARIAFSATGAGSILAKLDGVEIINETSVSTISTADVLRFRVDATSSFFVTYHDYIAFWDEVNVGDHCHDFLGPLKTIYQAPTADVQADFAPSAGTDNYAMVGTHDDDTTYNSDDTVGQKDLLTLPVPDSAAVGDGQILGAHAYWRMRKEAAGTVGIRPIVRSGAVEDLGTLQLPSTTYTNYWEIFSLNPDTGLAWAPSDDMEIGYALEAS